MYQFDDRENVPARSHYPYRVYRLWSVSKKGGHNMVFRSRYLEVVLKWARSKKQQTGRRYIDEEGLSARSTQLTRARELYG